MRNIYFLLFSLFQIPVLLGEPIANSEYIWIPSIKDIDFTDKKSIDSYINHPRNDNDSYLDIKERAQEVVNFLYLKLDEKQIPMLEIPTGNPLHIELDKKLDIEKCRYLDQERAQDLLVF